MIPAQFDYVRPKSIDEALRALDGVDAKVMAGGQSLLPLMKLRIARPSLVVDIGRLDLHGVKLESGRLEIGALTTYDELLRSGELPDALREAASAVGDLQVRNRGTVAGSIAHGDPASDVGAAFVALDGRVRVQSASGSRDVAAREFFVGAFMTAVEPRELVTQISLRANAPGVGSAYASVEDDASGYPLAGAAVEARAGGGTIDGCSIGLTGVAASPLAAPAVEAAVSAVGGVPDRAAIESALAELPLYLDDYRTNLLVVVLERAIESACARATGARAS